jgi:hypothetical protein
MMNEFTVARVSQAFLTLAYEGVFCIGAFTLLRVFAINVCPRHLAGDGRTTQHADEQ